MQWLLIASLLPAHVAVQAQSSRVDTGLQLRMTDALANRQAVGTESAGPVTSTVPVAADETSADGLLARGLSLRLTSGLKFDDNARRTNRFEERDVIVVMRPAIYLDGRLGRHGVRAGYEADIQRYLGLSDESRLDHKFLLNSDLDLGRRLKASIQSSLTYGSDAPGDIDTRPSFRDKPDRWREHSVGGDITLGRRIARAQVGVGYNVLGLRYRNNNQEERDYDRRDLIFSGRYNLGPKYAVVTTLAGAWIDYLDPRSNFDSREYIALIGLEWEATAKTSGTVKIGVRHRDFYDPGQSSYNDFDWDARVTWAPKTYSQFTAYSSRSSSEGGFIGGVSDGVTISDIWGLIWRHGISERLTFEAEVERTLARAGNRSNGGDDEFMLYGAGLRYRLNRWVDVFGAWEYTSRGSRNPGADYEASTVFIGLETSLDHAFGR